MTQRILVIKLGALGDIFIAMKPFQDIRRAFPDAHITLLTAPAFSGLGRLMPWFDAVLEDKRAPFWDIPAHVSLCNALKKGAFNLVVDFQNKPRTEFYFRSCFGGRVPWSGTAKGCAYPRPAIAQNMHRQEELFLQLRAAGVGDGGPLNLDWLSGDIAALSLPQAYAVFIPGCAPQHRHKRWPSARYAALAALLRARGMAVVAIGTKADEDAIVDIQREAPFVITLAGQTSFGQLASVMRGCRLVVGNDTGPTHLASFLEVPTVTLFSDRVDPVRAGPRGPRSHYLQKGAIAAITPGEVMEKLRLLGAI